MLTELATLKARLKVDSFDAADDALLTNLILLVSGRFDRMCNRLFARSASATYQFSADIMEVIPERLPLEAITLFEVKANETDGWVAQTDVDYVLRSGTHGPCVVSLHTRLGTHREQGRITYAGGFVLPGTDAEAGQTELPDEIEQACIEQCGYYWQQRDRLGLTSVAGAGGTIQSFAQMDLLPGVKALLGKYERYVL